MLDWESTFTTLCKTSDFELHTNGSDIFVQHKSSGVKIRIGTNGGMPCITSAGNYLVPHSVNGLSAIKIERKNR